MKIILHILGSMNQGGIESFIMNLYRTINRSEYQFHFLVENKNNFHSKEIEKLGGIIHYLPKRNYNIFKWHNNLKTFFVRHQNEYTVAHMHASSLSSIDVLSYAQRYGNIKIRIIHSHNTSISASKLHYAIHYINKLRIKKLATHYFACSDKARTWMFRYTGILNKTFIINNGIEIANYIYNVETRIKIRQALNLSNDDIVIGHVGSMTKVKNQSFLLSILSQLITINSNYKLILVGDGNHRHLIEDIIEKNNLKNNIILLGLRPDVNIIMQAMDCFVFPSIFEGLPVALVEAQTAGLLVIASDSISTMSKLLPEMEFISLNKSPLFWAEQINKKLISYSRYNTTSIIQKNGYDISKIAYSIEKIYAEY